MSDGDQLRTAAALLERGDWAGAADSFTAALDRDGEDPFALDGLGQALWWQSEVVRGIELREHAYAAFVRGARIREAIGIAVWLAREYFTVHANFAACNGWLERAQAHVDAIGDCPEKGWLSVFRGMTSTDPQAMVKHGEDAIDIGRAHADPALQIVGLSVTGLGLVYAGDVGEGMGRLDQAMVAATSGEIQNHDAVADVFCNTLLACERSADFERAEQWCRVATEYTRRIDAAPIVPFCHVTYGGVLTATGRWAEAEQEFRIAIDSFDVTHRGMKALAIGRLADLRLRQGRVDEARRLLRGYEDNPLALRAIIRLHVAAGETALAAAAIERRLAQVGRDGLLAAPLLSLLIEVDLARDDNDEAKRAARDLRALADRTDQRAILADAQFGMGRCLGADGIGEIERALELYSLAEMPYEAARARLALARLLAERQPEVAASEASRARTTFDRLGAARDRDAAAELMRTLGAPTPPGPSALGTLTRRESEVLSLLGEGRSNADIAKTLYLSIKTVEHHVGRVLTKLGLRSRAEVSAYLANSER
jgi:ATP/maltotriose-dependent transcriptional regulator MalT